MTRLLNDEIEKQLLDVFTKLRGNVKLLLFIRKENCEYCKDTKQLLEEVTAITANISLEVKDTDEDADLSRKFGIDKTPGLIIAAEKNGELIDYGIRFYGIPAGHEFNSLIQDILLVSSQVSGLDEPIRVYLSDLKTPLHLQVFVTPTCPYCPQAVVLAHRMAMENPLITAEAVEASEYPDLADRFNVSGVPHTVINGGAGNVIGAAPAEQMVAEIRTALK